MCPVCHSPNSPDALFCTTCGSPLSPVESPTDAHFLAPRTALRGGAFVIEEPLGAGGFGLTYRARESALGREVAVKEFFPFGSTRQNGRVVAPARVSGDDWTRELGAFREEALTLARFSHPAIVRAYAVWAEAGTAYFAMEFLRGQSLQKRLDTGRRFPVDEALGIIESIGEALARVHEAGLLHRDIKPDNILLCDGRAVLIDFGTARAFAADQTTPMTQLLTPGYAPLEQYGRRARFGPFTDVYALAATLYHALSGAAPPPAPDRAAGVELRPLNEINPLVSLSLARAIEGAMEIAVPKRPQTVGAWLDELRLALVPAPAPIAVPVAPFPLAPHPPHAPAPTLAPDFPALGPLPVAPDSEAPAPRESVWPRDAISTNPMTPPRPGNPERPSVPYAPEIPADARTPAWFWALLGASVLLLGFWWFHDPARSDLGAFDARLRPVLRLSSGVQSSLEAVNGSLRAVNGSLSEQSRAGLGGRVVPAQQRVVASLQTLAPASDEAAFSRDQLLDAERDKLAALQRLAGAQNGDDINGALDSLARADNERALWWNDYQYLKRQHRLG